MDQDDPEQRIAELERQLIDPNAAAGTTAETAHRPPPTTADIQKVALKGRGLRSIGNGSRLALIVVAGIWLYLFGDLVWDVYGYQVGTPATATDVRCRGDVNSDDPNVNCSGTWSLRGQAQQGPVHRVPHNWKSGQPLDVHVHGGTAFAAGSTGWQLGLSIAIVVLAITMSLGGFRALDRRFRQRWKRRRLRN